VVNNLSKNEITKIFKGEITNWKDIGGEDKDILVVSREAGSGTRGAFEEIMSIEKEVNGKKVSVVIENALIADGNGSVKANISKKENSIGYISLSYLDDSVRGLKIDEVEPTIENIIIEKYKVSRPFLMVTKGVLSESAQKYLDFVLSEEGQNIISEKLIPVK
jgi:phosphate transport system substrate-binding protein